MIEEPKLIWRRANALERMCTYVRESGNEWTRVNPSAATKANFQKWLDAIPVPPETSIFIVRDVRKVEQSVWSTVLTDWASVLVEGFPVRIIADDNTWILVFNEIGVAKFGSTTTNKAKEGIGE